MRKNIFVIVCIIAILSFGILEQVFINKSFDTLVMKVEDISKSISLDEVDKAKEKIDSLQQWWYARRDFLEFLCPNNDIKDIAKEIGELQGSLISDAKEDPTIRCRVLIEMAKNSKNLLAFKWKNIL